jgi:hypothetical protein
VRIDWELGRGLVGILVLRLKKAGRLKSSKARVIPDGSEKTKKLIWLIFYRLITVN